MSKRKIISSLFLSATVLGGLLFTQTPTVKAIELEDAQTMSTSSAQAPIFSLGRASNDKINQWKNENAFSNIYYIDSPRHAGPVTYELEAEVTDQNKTSFPLVAVTKNFYARTSYLSEPTSLAGLDLKVEWPK